MIWMLQIIAQSVQHHINVDQWRELESLILASGSWCYHSYDKVRYQEVLQYLISILHLLDPVWAPTFSRICSSLNCLSWITAVISIARHLYPKLISLWFLAWPMSWTPNLLSHVVSIFFFWSLAFLPRFHQHWLFSCPFVGSWLAPVRTVILVRDSFRYCYALWHFWFSCSSCSIPFSLSRPSLCYWLPCLFHFWAFPVIVWLILLFGHYYWLCWWLQQFHFFWCSAIPFSLSAHVVALDSFWFF